jgi:hypothetical protein
MTSIRKSISIHQDLHLSKCTMRRNINSFSDFEKLSLRGSQKLLTFGEYCQKNYNNMNKTNKRKIIQYFYKKVKKAQMKY